MKFNLLTNVINSIKEVITPIQSVAMTTETASVKEVNTLNFDKEFDRPKHPKHGEFKMIAKAINQSLHTYCSVEENIDFEGQYQALVINATYKSFDDAYMDYDSQKYYSEGLIDAIEDNRTKFEVYYRPIANNYFVVYMDTKKVFTFHQLMDFIYTCIEE